MVTLTSYTCASDRWQQDVRDVCYVTVLVLNKRGKTFCDVISQTKSKLNTFFLFIAEAAQHAYLRQYSVCEIGRPERLK